MDLASVLPLLHIPAQINHKCPTKGCNHWMHRKFICRIFNSLRPCTKKGAFTNGCISEAIKSHSIHALTGTVDGITRYSFQKIFKLDDLILKFNPFDKCNRLEQEMYVVYPSRAIRYWDQWRVTLMSVLYTQ